MSGRAAKLRHRQLDAKWTYNGLIGELESVAKAGKQMSGNATYQDLAAAARKFMCCIELRDAMTL
jgi:hypothetical protein